MLEVSLPEHIIKLFKLTCCNYSYSFDGNLIWTKEYKKGKLYGKVTLYRSDFRNIRYIQEYKNDILHGEHIVFFVYGTLDYILKYKNGKCVSQLYQGRGFYLLRLNTLLPEKIIKLFKLTCRNYVLWERKPLRYEFVFWDMEPIRSTVEYKKGVRHGYYVEYWSGMCVHAIGQYKNGEMNGKRYLYREDGTFDRIEVYKKGMKIC
jgi:antitoxin component YwqK of YwqJK toxin-antitoxin module